MVWYSDIGLEEEVFDRRFTHFPIYGLTQEQLDYMADAILESIDEMQKGI